MKQGWEIKKLGDVCKLKPQKKEAREKLSEDALVTFLPMEDLGVLNKDINPKKQRILREVVNGYTYFADNDVLLAKITPCFENGKLGIARDLINGIGFGSSEYMVFRSNDEIIPEYLFYFLSRCDFRDEGYKMMTGAVGHKRVSKEWVENYNIPIPPISEQERIVSILDKAFSAIDQVKQNAEKNLKNAKELFDSYLNGIFTNKGENWEEKILGEVCQTGAGGTPLKIHKEYYENGNIPWLRSGEVDKKDITNCELFITEQGLNNSSAQLFPVNTVLVAMYGATAGQVGILRFECSTNQAVCGILPNEKFIPEFLYYKFLCCKDELVSQAVGGAQPNISQIKIKNTLVPIPPLPEQEKIVQKLDALSVETKQLEEIYQQKVNELEELKKSILQRAFNGELI